MTGRRIVAAHRDGRLVVVEDTVPSNAFTSVPGFDPATIWGTPAFPTLPWDGNDPGTTATSERPDLVERRQQLPDG
jgi:hypothetical protein